MRPGIQAGLVVYDLRTQRRLFFVDLTELRTAPVIYANDVTVDGQGNAYVTDSVGATVYKIDVRGEASVLASDPRLGNSIFGANGIDFDPAGSLIVAVSGAASLARISLTLLAHVSTVRLPWPFLTDGLTRTPSGTWLAVGFIPALDASGNLDPAHFQPAMVSYRSEDGWLTAHPTGVTALNHFATTVATCGSTACRARSNPRSSARSRFSPDSRSIGPRGHHVQAAVPFAPLIGGATHGTLQWLSGRSTATNCLSGALRMAHRLHTRSALDAHGNNHLRTAFTETRAPGHSLVDEAHSLGPP